MTDVKLVDPRTEADAQIARSFQIVVDAGEDHADNDAPHNAARSERRDYTPEELETLFFSLSTALVQLKKVPRGQEMHDLTYAKLKAELGVRRKRPDLVVEAEFDKRAVEIIKQAFGDDVDLSAGTTGHHLAKVVDLQLKDMAACRKELVALASVLTRDVTYAKLPEP